MIKTTLLCAAACVFTAAPALAQAPGQESAVIDASCDRDCLFGFTESYMQALAAKDPSSLPLAQDVIFTENNVVLPVGRGLWRSVSGVREGAMQAADAQTGNAAWFGTVEEHGNPAYYAMRLKVKDGLITEVETVVTRRPDMAKPFGDPDQVNHDPLFNETLPAESRRPRERMRSIADGYFETVELNDGQIFTHFTDDCARLENGVETTAGGFGAGSTATGCENQFKLGIYRINKRVRERRYELIDEERGIVVGSGFFDHANTFDEYLLTDGRTMQTVLKWPNSITLLEAFRIEDGAIDRIEAVFTYVPYFMHSPFAQPGPVDAPAGPAPDAPCDEACLIGVAQQYMDAMDAQDPSRAPWADTVRFAESNVPMMIGDAQWGADPAYSPPFVVLPNAETGDVFWYGVVTEHEQPAYYAMRLNAAGGRISDVEAILGRREMPGPFAEPEAYAFDAPELPEGRRASAAEMTASVEAFYAAQAGLGGGAVAANVASGCEVFQNGEAIGGCTALAGDHAVAGTEESRDVRIISIDEARGLVAASVMYDRPSVELVDGAEIQYPHTRGVMDVFRFEGGEIARIDGVSVLLPYGMPIP
jgi:hypothetical protein